jgi:BirA family biotin operon repressor/biotin-[acetyl-CoA-carboxylase] ligase
VDVDRDFGLVVRRDDGSVTTVRSGEVSVRGLYGYTE